MGDFQSVSRLMRQLKFSQDASGKQVDEWSGVPVRVTDMAISPDMKRLVVIGMGYQPAGLSSADSLSTQGGNRELPPPNTAGTGDGTQPPQPPSENRIVVYDFKTKVSEQWVIRVVIVVV